MTPAPDPAAPRRPASLRSLVLLLFAASCLARIVLAVQGGQFYFGDEERYRRGVMLYQALADADFTRARDLAMLPEHMLFTWLASALTGLQHLLAQFTPYGNWAGHPAHLDFTLWISAALLSLFSALNIPLIWRLATALGASESEAAWAALLMAASHIAFYYSRHLLPYDFALGTALLALTLGLGGRSTRRAWACGACAGCAYGLYNGYWYLVPTVLLTYAFHMRDEPERWRLWIGATTGAVAALLAPLAYGTWAGGRYFWTILVDFSGSVSQGTYDEGWSLVWEFLWHAEGAPGLSLALLIALAAGLALHRRQPMPRWTQSAALAAFLAYAALVLASNGLRVFVVYGRSVKPLVPFLCLLGGWALPRLLGPRRGWSVLAAGGVVAIGWVRLTPHFTRVFPGEVEIAVLRHYGWPKRTLSVAGAMYREVAMSVTRPDLALANAQSLYPALDYLGFPPGRTLLRWPHPLTYLPFQYEGHTPRQRLLLRHHDISMRLIALDDPAAVPDDLPTHLRARPLPPTAQR